MKRIIYFLLLYLAFGCNTSRTQVSLPPADSSLVNKKWSLTQMQGTAIGAGRVPYILFSDSARLAGHGGCNSFASRYTVFKENLFIKDLISTKMACDNMAAESRFFNYLQQVDAYSIDRGVLSLYVRNRRVMSFAVK